MNACEISNKINLTIEEDDLETISNDLKTIFDIEQFETEY